MQLLLSKSVSQKDTAWLVLSKVACDFGTTKKKVMGKCMLMNLASRLFVFFLTKGFRLIYLSLFFLNYFNFYFVDYL